MTPDLVWTLALALPQAEEAPHFEMTSFRVRGKIFATVPPDHAHVHVFVSPDEIDAAIAADPASTSELLWGKQRAGVRVSIAQVDSARLEALLTQAWRRKAPKRLQ